MKLDLGCGDQVRPGFVGVDRSPSAGAQIVCDLTTRFPFRSDCVEEVWMDNLIEHVLDVPHLMSEVARVCRNGAQVTVRTPHFTSQASWRDPTHLHHFSYFSLDYFENRSARHYTGGGFRIARRRLSFGGGLLGVTGRILFALSAEAWEKHFSFVFRGGTLTFELVVEKH